MKILKSSYWGLIDDKWLELYNFNPNYEMDKKAPSHVYCKKYMSSSGVLSSNPTELMFIERIPTFNKIIYLTEDEMVIKYPEYLV